MEVLVRSVLAIGCVEGYLSGKHMGNCMIMNSKDECKCCQTGFRGVRCQDSCVRCKSRFSLGVCYYYCDTGYWGKYCNNTCPVNCDVGLDGRRLCSRHNGLVYCQNGCRRGFYGMSCDQMCNNTCKNQLCYQHGGSCHKCHDGYYGDFCNKMYKSETVSYKSETVPTTVSRPNKAGDIEQEFLGLPIWSQILLEFIGVIIIVMSMVYTVWWWVGPSDYKLVPQTDY